MTAANLETFLGTGTAFLPIVAFYSGELTHYEGDWRGLLSVHLPVVLEGLAGAALHGLIHMGYGSSSYHSFIHDYLNSCLHFVFVLFFVFLGVEMAESEEGTTQVLLG